MSRRSAAAIATPEAAADPRPAATEDVLSRCDAVLHLPFSMAFQPIVDIEAGRVIAYEALVRGPHNESAASILQTLSAADDAERPVRDLACNLVALQSAARLGLNRREADLFLNLHPESDLDLVRSLNDMLAAASNLGFPPSRLVLELSETEPIADPAALARALAPFRAAGLRIAIDDFGAGHAGLTRLLACPADIVKLDMALIRDVATSSSAAAVLRGVISICHDLDLMLIAEGVERPAQQRALERLGIYRMQGNLFGAPARQSLPAWPASPAFAQSSPRHAPAEAAFE